MNEKGLYVDNARVNAMSEARALDIHVQILLPQNTGFLLESLPLPRLAQWGGCPEGHSP